MTLRSSLSDPDLRRHNFVYLAPRAWRVLVEDRADLAGVPLVAEWVDRGWPLIARRRTPGESDGAPLGLALPPHLGKRRLAFLAPYDDIVWTAAPPRLSAAIAAAPPHWRSSLHQIVELAAGLGVVPCVFGSLAWRLLTGLDYLTPGSDLDLVLPLPATCAVDRLTEGLAPIDAAAPMRLDGELVRADGAAVNWREHHAAPTELLVKRGNDTIMLPAGWFSPRLAEP